MADQDPGALPSPFSSMMARLHLAETYAKQGRTDDALRTLDAVLASWADADRPLLQLDHAHALRAKLAGGR